MVRGREQPPSSYATLWVIRRTAMLDACGHEGSKGAGLFILSLV